jgi:hypothetical protein
MREFLRRESGVARGGRVWKGRRGACTEYSEISQRYFLKIFLAKFHVFF